MKTRRCKIVSLVLVICLIFSTTSIFANSLDGEYKTVQTNESFVVNGERYQIDKHESEASIETWMYDSQRNLVGHMKYDKRTDKLFDLQNNREFPLKMTFTPNTRNAKSRVDSEGYYFQGDYTVDLGEITTAASLILAVTTHGASLGLAQKIAKGLEWGATGVSYAFYIKGELWMKEDVQYIYSKKIESIIGKIGGNNRNLGSYTLLQKKSNR